jgi:hypothetical protein
MKRPASAPTQDDRPSKQPRRSSPLERLSELRHLLAHVFSFVGIPECSRSHRRVCKQWEEVLLTEAANGTLPVPEYSAQTLQTVAPGFALKAANRWTRAAEDEVRLEDADPEIDPRATLELPPHVRSLVLFAHHAAETGWTPPEPMRAQASVAGMHAGLPLAFCGGNREAANPLAFRRCLACGVFACSYPSLRVCTSCNHKWPRCCTGCAELMPLHHLRRCTGTSWPSEKPCRQVFCDKCVRSCVCGPVCVHCMLFCACCNVPRCTRCTVGCEVCSHKRCKECAQAGVRTGSIWTCEQCMEIVQSEDD